MAEIINQDTYTVHEAATRTGRTIRTIRRWIRDGLHCRITNGVIHIDHGPLMAQYRARTIQNPTRKRDTK